jgi:two-component system KDP operon response regulator KdpE
MSRVLVVDDEPQIVRALTISLAARSYDVISASTGKQALSTAASEAPDIVLLDLGLPDIDGIDVIRGLRTWSTAPIIILTGRNHGAAKVDALDAGADDYITKPFNLDELLARMRAVNRRSPAATDDVTATFGDLTVDLLKHRITSSHDAAAQDGKPLDVILTRTEWLILEMLIRSPGRLITQQELLRTIRRDNQPDQSHNLRQFMNQLRHKLEADPARPQHLLTEPGMGYRFVS